MTAVRQGVHVQVGGRVQGVGYRAFAQSCARRRGVTGLVRNLPGGRVEVVAVGPHADLEDLLDDLRSGPAAGVVRDVQVEWLVAAAQYDSFTIEI